MVIIGKEDKDAQNDVDNDAPEVFAGSLLLFPVLPIEVTVGDEGWNNNH